METLKEELKEYFKEPDMWIDFLHVTGEAYEDASKEDVKRYIDHLERELEGSPE